MREGRVSGVLRAGPRNRRRPSPAPVLTGGEWEYVTVLLARREG